MQPLKPPVASLPTLSFRDRLRRGQVKKARDNQATLHRPLESDDNFILIRIPRNLSYSDLRTKDAFVDEAGKQHKETAMLTVSTSALKDADYTMSFTDEENSIRLDMPARTSVTCNITLDYGAVQLFNSETGEVIEAAA